MTRLRPALVGLALAVLGAGACDWTVFDKLALKAPIRALPRPNDMDSSTYPGFVLPVAKPRGNAELLVVGIDNTALADLTFGTDGHLGTQTVGSDRFLLNGATIGTLGAAAYLEDATDDVPRIVAVIEDQRQPILVTLDSSNQSFTVETLGPALTVEVGAIAVGETATAGRRDAVLASGNQLIIMNDTNPTDAASCDLPSAVVSLAVGDHWIVAGQPAGDGAAWVVQPDYVPGTDGNCAILTSLVDHTGAQGFGTVVLAADLDDDGTREVVVSAPLERGVYFFKADDGTTWHDPIIVGGGTSGCGTAMAVGKVDKKTTLIIGDPGPTDVSGPGAVYLQDLADLKTAPKLLENPNQDDYVRFGEQVGVVSFTDASNQAVDLLWVTARAATAGDPGVVYLYFWVNDPNSDPRVF